MSTVTVNGTLILDGDLTCDGDITVTSNGLVIPIPSQYTIKSIFSCQTKRYVTCNGKSRKMTSLYGNVVINGLIDGEGQGFPANRGPGCNSVLIDNLHHSILGYGATHAGLGYLIQEPGTTGYHDEEITLTGSDIDQQGILLSAAPVDDNIAVNPENGPTQYYPDDFYIDGNMLSWSGKPMGYVVISGEVIRVLYNGTTGQQIPGPKRPYGSYEAPLSLGSGSAITRGGGGIWIEAPSGTVTVDGVVNMNGESGLPGVNTGGAAGGSVWISAWNIAGTGIITAEGGSTSWPYAGGGGGGYITMGYERSYGFTGTVSVVGENGGTEGRFHLQLIKPFFEENFTGRIWNTKWWETVSEPVTLNNFVLFDTSSDPRSPAVQSLFSISGNIKVDMDYKPFGAEADYYSNYFVLYKDFQNWIGLAKKNGFVFGVFTLDGVTSQSGVAVNNTNLTFRILKEDSTFTIQYYDSSSSPQTLFSESLPELSSNWFNIRMGISKLEYPDATSTIIEHLALTNQDLNNRYVALSAEPLDSSNVAVNVAKGTSQYPGIDFYVSGKTVRWDASGLDMLLPSRLENYLIERDVLRVVYDATVVNNDVIAGFDNFKVFSGILYNIETTEPVLYVDPVHGSDSSDGRALTPLQNLFVATAWSRIGGTVVLYDGTHNPTEVAKDLTIMGAYGAMPVVTTANVQDTTGSNWEDYCLSFDECQGRVQNLRLIGTASGLYAHATDNIEVVGCEVSDATTGLSFLAVPTQGAIVRGTKIHGVQVGIDFSGCYDPYVNSCVIYDTTVGIYAADTTNITIMANTLDMDATAIWFDGTCSGVIASNNLSNCDAGFYSSEDSMPVSVIDNNFSDTAMAFGGRYPDVDSSNYAQNPFYADQAGRDYRITRDATYIDGTAVGFGLPDRFMRDFQGLNRAVMTNVNVGAFEYVDGTHVGDWYVSGAVWEDSSNFGGAGDPFRTLDSAMLNDGTVHVAVGHLDSYHLGLGNSPVRLDGSTATFRTHFGNLDISRAIYVSPNGNDASGTGLINNPYRTINGALANSSDGDFIVVMSGEYPEFTGLRGRSILFQPDLSLIQVDGTRRFLYDLFDQPDLRRFGHLEYDPQWALTYAGDSSATVSDGFLRLTHDGTNAVRADSTFTFERDFDISVDIRNVSEPVLFSVHNADTTATLSYDNGSYRVDMAADESSSYCYGQMSIGPAEERGFWTDHICLTTDDTRSGWAPLSMMTTDCSSSAVNLIGGVPQEYGTDYRLEGGRLVWKGRGLDGVLEPGDTVRVIYKAKGVSEKVRAVISLHGARLSIKASDGHSMVTLARRDVVAGLDGQWGASFYMDGAVSESPCQAGRAFMSNFQAIATTFTGTDIDEPFLQKTERKTVIIYRDRS